MPKRQLSNKPSDIIKRLDRLYGVYNKYAQTYEDSGLLKHENMGIFGRKYQVNVRFKVYRQELRKLLNRRISTKEVKNTIKAIRSFEGKIRVATAGGRLMARERILHYGVAKLEREYVIYVPKGYKTNVQQMFDLMSEDEKRQFFASPYFKQFSKDSYPSEGEDEKPSFIERNKASVQEFLLGSFVENELGKTFIIATKNNSRAIQDYSVVGLEDVEIVGGGVYGLFK